jgi:hypothetical protein
MDRFEDLDLREEPAGSELSNSDAATQFCTQITFICAADQALRTPACCV